MRLIALITVPALVGIIALMIRATRRRKLRRIILSLTAIFHVMIVVSLHLFPLKGLAQGYLFLDALGLLFLSLISVLFFLVSIYSWGYFHHEREAHKEGVSPLFTPCMLFFLTAMTLTTLTNHLGLLWVAIEGTTLVAAPLIYYHHHAKALEAAWKFLLICSVGIALALLGLFFVAFAGGVEHSDLDIPALVANAIHLEPRWLRIGFILVLVGFGTKMGLAPLHSWLPDAHSEAPTPVSALLSGALLNCAFLGVLRFNQVCVSAGLGAFTSRLFIFFGLLSLFIAAAFILKQRDYKRLFAYSSIEHMGIVTLGIGVGAGFGGLLHVVNHSLTKALLFLTAGQILIAYRTKMISEIHGLARKLPLTGSLLTVGSLAILGMPPFAPFISEFFIFKDGLAHGHAVVMVLYLLALGVVFVGMSRLVFGMIQGEPRELPVTGEKPSWPMLLAPGLLAIPVMLFGVYLPSNLVRLITNAGRVVGGMP